LDNKGKKDTESPIKNTEETRKTAASLLLPYAHIILSMHADQLLTIIDAVHEANH